MTIDDLSIFERPANWRTAAALKVAHNRRERQAAASPGPAFPQALALVERAIEQAPEGPVVDLGAGLAGVSDWLVQRTRRFVVPTDSAHASCVGARHLFPGLTPVRADLTALPVRPESVAAILIAGVTSLLDGDAFDACVDEAVRCLRVGGRLALVDLVSATRTDVRRAPNVFRSSETICSAFAAYGFTDVDHALGETGVGSWADFNSTIGEHVRTHNDHELAYDAWRHDQAHIQRVMESGVVLVGAMTFVRGSRGRGSTRSTA